MPRSAFALLAASVFSLSNLGAQTVVPDEPSCPRCSIRMARVALLGAADGPGSLRGLAGYFTVDAKGRYWVGQNNDLPMIFDAGSRYIATVGKSGSGPGEFRIAQHMVALPGDSVLILDIGNRRATIVDQALKPARALSLQQQLMETRVIRWPDLVLTVPASMRPERGEPLQLVSFAGSAVTVLREFGSRPDETRPWFLRPVIAVTGSRIWVADSHNYRLSEWDTNGKLLRTFERRPDWFRWPVQSPGRITQPNPRICAIQIDDQGLIWVFTNIAAPTAAEAFARANLASAEISIDQIDHEKLYHTIVEVIDPKTQRLVTRTRINQYVVTALPNRRAVIYAPDPDGTPRMLVVSLTIAGRS